RALAILQPTFARDPSNSLAGLLLIQARLRANDRKKAQEVFEQLMANPTATVIVSYANFLAATARYDQALTALGKLQELQATPYERQMAMFAFYRRHL